MDIDIKIANLTSELFKYNEVRRIKVEVELINGSILSQEEIKPNKLKDKKE